jgi:hypothetical protein
MGGVLGVSAYGRTQEKVAGATNVSTSTSVPTPELSSAPPSSFGSGGFNHTTPSTFGSPPVASSGFGGGFDSNPAPTDNSFGNAPSKPIVRRPV